MLWSFIGLTSIRPRGFKQRPLFSFSDLRKEPDEYKLRSLKTREDGKKEGWETLCQAQNKQRKKHGPEEKTLNNAVENSWKYVSDRVMVWICVFKSLQFPWIHSVVLKGFFHSCTLSTLHTHNCFCSRSTCVCSLINFNFGFGGMCQALILYLISSPRQYLDYRQIRSVTQVRSDRKTDCPQFYWQVIRSDLCVQTSLTRSQREFF